MFRRTICARSLVNCTAGTAWAGTFAVMLYNPPPDSHLRLMFFVLLVVAGAASVLSLRPALEKQQRDLAARAYLIGYAHREADEERRPDLRVVEGG